MAFVRAHPGATLYHTLQWRDLIRDVFGHRPEYLVAAADGQIRGVLPLFHVTLPMVGAKLISLPYDIGSGGALAADDVAEQALVAQAMAVARERGVDYLEIRHGARRAALDTLPLRTQEPVLISELALDDPAAVRSRIASNHRQSVRVAAARGVRVRTADSKADYLAFYDIYLEAFRDFGTPPYPRRYFTALWHRLHEAGEVRLLVAEADGRCLGGLILFCWGRSLVNKFTACLPEAVPLRAYAALYGHAIELGLAGSYQRLSLGSSSRDQAGLIEFKQRWGAVTQTAVLYDFDVRGRAPDLAGYYDADALSRRIWRRLPVPVTRLGGSFLNRWYC